jgi:hypothetical protein
MQYNQISLEGNLKLMKTLIDAWNYQDWDTFNKRHAEPVTVYWPGQPEPTIGRPNHKAESVEFLKTFPDNHIDTDPYKILFGHDDSWRCSVANFTGTFKDLCKVLMVRLLSLQIKGLR